MFDNDNNRDDEESFSDAYKSQILGSDDDEEEEEGSSKLWIIIGLVVLIAGLSVLGYTQLSKETQPPPTQTVEEEPIKVEEVEAPPQSMMINNMDELLMEDDINESESEAEESMDTIKLEITKEPEEKNPKEKSRKQKDTYLEQLAELSKEIDGEEE